MNKRRFAPVALALLLLFLSACQDEARPAPATGADSFINLDAYARYGIVTSTGFDYTDSELRKLEQDGSHGDYAEVVKRFVERELDRKLLFLNTADGTYNPRRVTAGTTDGMFYAFILNRWHQYGGIWTINRYAEYGDAAAEGVRPPERAVQYELVDDPGGLEATVRDWLDQALTSKERSQKYLLLDGQVFVLLTAAEGESVELVDVSGDEYMMVIAHANSIADPDGRYGDKPYILIEVRSPVSEIVFQQYSSLRTEHPSLYMP